MRRRERGFALLLVLAMAGAIAMLLYLEMPRAIFESQRSKEELLVERGEQYKRAIGLYFKKYKKWPQEIKDLEETNGLRFLRHRFVDPMTGKDDWRIIHTNGMMLTDSLVQKPQDPLKAGKDANGNPLPQGQGGNQQTAGGFGSSGFGSSQGFGSSNSGFGQGGGFGASSGSNSGFGQPQVVQPVQAAAIYDPATGQFRTPGQDGPTQAWQQRRGNDRNLPAPIQQVAQTVPGQPPPPQPVPQPPAGTVTDTTEDDLPQAAEVFSGTPPDGANPNPQPGQPNPTIAPGIPNPNAPAPPGVPGRLPQPPTGAYDPSQPNYNQPYTPGNQAFRPGFGPGSPMGGPGGPPGTPPASAMDIINRALTQPRPNPAFGGMSGPFGQQGNMPGVSGTSGSFGQQGNMPGVSGTSGPLGQQGNMQGVGGMGPGMAGVATKYEGDSIRVYNERKKYQEWEFVYDASKDPALNPQLNQQQGGLKGSVANPGFGSFNSSGGNSSGFGGGGSSGFGGGSSSGFGSSSGSGSSFGQPSPNPNNP